MVKSARISVITVTYNSSKKVRAFLKSFAGNKLVKEIILIENNSSDSLQTRKIVDQCKNIKSIPTVTLYTKKFNDGFGKSCNYGAKKSKGEYLLFINPDTNVKNNSLSVLLDHAVESGADLIGGKSLTYNGSNHLTVVRTPNLNIGLFEFSNLGKLFKTQRGHKDFYYLDNESIVSGNDDVQVDAVGGAYLMIRSKSFTKLNGFDESFFMYLEDVDICVRARQLGMRVVYCPHSTIKHIGGASSDNKYKIRHQAWFDSRKYYYKKHLGFFSNLLIQPLYTIEEFLLKKIRKI